MAEYKSNNNRHSSIDKLMSEIQNATNQVLSQIGDGTEFTVKGTVELDDSELTETEKRIDNLQAKGKKGVKIPVEADTKKMESQIEKAINKKNRSKIEPSIEDIAAEGRITGNVEKLRKKMQKTYEKLYGEDGSRLRSKSGKNETTIGFGEAKDYASNYMLYKKYVDDFGFELDKKFQFVFKNIDDYVRGTSKGSRGERVDNEKTVDELIKSGKLYRDALSQHGYDYQVEKATQEAKTTIRKRQKTETTSYTTKAGITHTTSNTEGTTTGNVSGGFESTPNNIREVGEAAKSAKQNVDELSSSLGK